MMLAGNTLYLGGSFTHIHGVSRNRLAAIGCDGTLLPWKPNANGPIHTIAYSGRTLYIAVSFRALGGNLAVRMASVNSDGTINW
ncbi:MAG: hypothetical protein NZM25_06145 [Leptospiraceae bacterium]|nr:hypothetical protein [Leptospiraceae bacterium]